MSNLKQWGAIFVMYTDTHDGFFMGGHPADGEPNPSQSWQIALRSYYGGRGGIMCCPMAAKEPGGSGMGGSTFEPWGLIGNGDYGSYGINTYIYNRPKGGVVNKPGTEGIFWRRTDVKGAAIVPLLLDAVWLASPPWPSDDPPEYEGERWSPGGGADGMGIFCINRHNGFVNGLFLDLTVRKVGLKQLWILKWNRDFDIHAPLPDWPNVGNGWLAKFRDYYDPYE